MSRRVLSCGSSPGSGFHDMGYRDSLHSHTLASLLLRSIWAFMFLFVARSSAVRKRKIDTHGHEEKNQVFYVGKARSEVLYQRLIIAGILGIRLQACC